MKSPMKISILVLTLIMSLGTFAEAQQLGKIPANYDTTPWALPTENLPLSNTPRPWGEYPNPCGYSNLRYDDPIQNPAKFSSAPLHVFFGNTLANANSNYTSLKTTGESTCWGGPINRSSIYMPAMMNAAGQVVLPDFLDVFYHGNATTHPFPRGLKMMIGPKYMDQSYQWDVTSPRYAWSFNQPGGWWGNANNNWIWKNFVPTLYPDYAFNAEFDGLSIRVVSPDCWDGVHLDMPDHYSHLAYSGPDASVEGVCPADHPVKIPQTTITVYYRWIDRTDMSGWYLSSDKFGLKNDAPGTNWYVGFIPAWDDDIMNTWVTKILNTEFFGAYGKLGDGRRLEQPPTSKIFGPTQNLGPGRQPLFLWALMGPFWRPGGYVQPTQMRVAPPAK